MTQDERKRIGKRLRSIDKKRWDALSETDQNLAIKEYAKAVDLKKLSTTNLINVTWDNAMAMNFLVLGVVLGVIGGLAANMLDRYFVKFGVSYDAFIAVLFLMTIYGFSKLPDMIISEWYKQGKLLDRLLKKKESGE